MIAELTPNTLDMIIPSTRTTPDVIYHKDEFRVDILGVSMPEDAKSFYDPIASWFTEYQFTSDKITCVRFRLDYFNTSSAKCILDLLLTIDARHRRDHNLQIVWEYDVNDPELREVGEEFGMLIKCPIRLTEYQS
jgi:hypothetical protein